MFIKGLQSVQGKLLNGNKATITSFDHSKKRYGVRLSSGEVKALRARNLDPVALLVAQKVAVTGLKSEKGRKYIGRIGFVEEFNQANQRYKVVYFVGDEKLAPIYLKRENLRVL